MRHKPENDKWEIDRVPTKSEQIAVIVATSLICVVCGVFLARTLSEYLKPGASFNNPFPLLVLVGSIFFLCVLILSRIVFTKSQKVTTQIGVSVSYSLVVLGVCILISIGAKFISKNALDDLSIRVHTAWAGFACITLGMTSLMIAKRKKK